MMNGRYICLLLALLFVTACYEGYVKDYEVQGVGFANPTDVRSVIVGEKMEFSTGIALGGVISNPVDRQVTFGVDYSLVNDHTYESFLYHKFSYIQTLFKSVPAIQALPASQYEIVTAGGEAGRVTIPAGSHLGVITIRLSDAFLADEANRYPRYVIPLRVEDAGSLSIISGHESTVLGVRFECCLFGNWWHGGVAYTEGADPQTVRYRLEIPQSDSKVWTLTTAGPNSVTSNACGPDLNTSSPQMSLTLNADGSILVAAVAGADHAVSPDGESRFERASLLQNRKIYLSYQYDDTEGKTWHVRDTLVFRNRLRDGVNEWMDENPEKYQ